MTEEEIIAAFEAHCQRIAQANDNKFLVDIRRMKFDYEVIVIETADNHTLFAGLGKTITEAIADARKTMRADCACVDYVYVE